ncbi:hypothetical protein [Rhizobium sp. P007]|jgi:hypothetical protein|uniref:hypothetical protein n=1 Tax=Rhizobium sp. P007 TaxID=285908 RepID=UPI00115A633E|nr:hypothetical protein [Rhizobium sp. P007]CAD7045835.1 hypothetical protein RP007_04930 [Rhizobium sp. P007]
MRSTLEPYGEQEGFEAELAAAIEAFHASVDFDLGELPPALVDRNEALSARLTNVLLHSRSNFTTRLLDELGDRVSLEELEEPDLNALRKLLDRLRGSLPAGTVIAPPTQSDWSEAFAIVQEASKHQTYELPNTRRDNLRSALERLRNRGHDFQLLGPGVDPRSPGFKTATAAVSTHLSRLGRFNAFRQLIGAARAVCGYEFDVVLYGRNSRIPPREPSYPFGFLWQIAAAVPEVAITPNDPPNDWAAALDIARDVVALVDVETYGQFWTIGTDYETLQSFLGDATLHDHLFSLQQWSPHLTPIFLESFFGKQRDAELRDRLGWGIEDVANAARALIARTRHSPCLVSTGDFSRYLSIQVAESLMKDFAHPSRSPNAAYTSPFDASKADLMFRPLIGTDLPNTYLMPSHETIGPALYEATMIALSRVLSQRDMADLRGQGLERAVAELLRFRGIAPTAVGLQYKQGGQDGECDVVVEDDRTIIFFECKAKAVTRAAMQGDRNNALFTYLEGVTAAQAQALQHETILERDGYLEFEDGTRLDKFGRRVVRVSMTLHDHGTLHDRFLFAQLSSLIAGGTVRGTDPKQMKRVAKLNEIIVRLRDNLGADLDDGTEPDERFWVRALPTALLSYSHLATLLVEHASPSALARVLSKPATFATGSVLKEYHFMRTQGLLEI